jgi:pyrroline-5-carboxylate reductase
VSAWPARVGIVGTGAMGRALAVGLARGAGEGAEPLLLADSAAQALEAAVAESGGRPVSVGEAAQADLVWVAVKPGDGEAVLAEVAPRLRPGGALLSVMAGWTLDRLAAAAPGVALVRTMPNLAVRHGAGVVAMAARGLDPRRADALRERLRALGTVVELPEALFPGATAVAGSGPGFLALVAEGLEEGAVRAGLSRGDARGMVAGVLAGTAALLADGGDPAALRQRVSSPAGTTVAGLAALERGAVRAHLADAVAAAARRAQEI